MAALAAAAVLAVGSLTACSSENVSCNLNSCDVTFDRGVNAEASVLGVDVKLVGVDNGNVTLDVGGTNVTVPVNGDVQAEGFDIDVQEVTDEKVVIRISQAG
jgi:hypothetical protein